MPPCIVNVLRRTPTRIITFSLAIGPNTTGRAYGTNETQNLRKDFLTLLHRTNAILPKILPSSESSSWSKLIGTSGNLLSGVSTRKPRIAVWGADGHSQSTELVSALLDDPLVSDTRNVDALRNRRREDTDSILTIRYGELDVSMARLSLGLSWLQKLDADIVEIPATHPDSKTLLYDADVQIIATSSFSTPLPSGLESLLLNPASFLAFRYPTSDPEATDVALARLLVFLPALSGALNNKIFTVYPPRALSALDTFRQASNSTTAIQAFQDDFLNSGITTLSQSISLALPLDKETLKSRHAQLVLSGALEACRNTIEKAYMDAAAVQTHVDKLHTRIDEAFSSSLTDVLGGQEAPEVGNAVQRSAREMRETIDALKWWRLPFKVDDLGDTLTRAAGHAWCRDLEAKLQFQTGRLSVLRSALIAETHASFSLLPSAFNSAVLVNTLHQLSTRPPDLSPNTLTYPLVYRLQQLQYPIISLHRRAQRVVLAAMTTAFLSAGGSYAAWFFGWVTSSTAVGLAALGAVVGVRWLVGNWERRKKRWWDDWRRVGEGLERDLKDILGVVMQEKVTVVPSTAAKELSKAVARRLSEMKEIEAELESLELSSRNLYPQQRTSRE